MKKLSVLALSAALMSTPALAESGENYTVNPTTSQVPSSVDLSAVFENNDSLQVAILSKQEMEETEGAVFEHRGGGAGGFGMGGAGAGFGARLGNLGSGKIGTKLGELGSKPKLTGFSEGGTKIILSHRGTATSTIAGGVLGGAGYAHQVPQNQRTKVGYATAIGTGAIGGGIRSFGGSVGHIRSTVSGASVGMAGAGISSKMTKSKIGENTVRYDRNR